MVSSLIGSCSRCSCAALSYINKPFDSECSRTVARVTVLCATATSLAVLFAANVALVRTPGSAPSLARLSCFAMAAACAGLALVAIDSILNSPWALFRREKK